MSTSRVVARNSALNLAGQALPLVVAVVAIPPLLRGLGDERFGILTLAWAAIGYFGLFEFGLGRALTHAVAVRLGADEHDDLPAIVWTALWLLFLLGCAGGLALALATPWLVHRVINVPAGLQAEALTSFRILAVTLPFVVMSVGLRGLMEAYQDFGVATVIRIPLAASMFLGPLLALPFSRSLVVAVSTVAAVRAVGWVAHLVVCLRKYHPMRQGATFSRAAMASLLRYGGWSTVSNIVSPLMVSMDRFLIGALLPLATVTHYVTPYETVTKLLIVPVALLAAVFPVFASTYEANRDRMAVLYERALRMVYVVTFPAVLVAVGLANEGLHLWVGGALPPVSGVVLQYLAVGTFFNGIAQVPLSALQGAGRPDLVAKLHMVELPLYATAVVVLAMTFGLPGVAIAWSARVTVDAVALMAISRWKLGLSPAPARAMGGWWPVAAMSAAFAIAAMLESTVWRVAFVGGCVAVFAWLAWSRLLTVVERAGLRAWVTTRSARPMGAG